MTMTRLNTGSFPIRVKTPQCMMCHKSGEIVMSYRSWLIYQRGEHLIQDAAPHMQPEIREQLKTGIHPRCWTDMFGEEE